MVVPISQSMSFRNFARSILIMIAALSGLLGGLVLLLGLLAPFWFETGTTVTFNKGFPSKNYTESIGMTGYVDYNGRWHNLNLLDKASNQQPFPMAFKGAQVLYITACVVTAVAVGAMCMLALKPYRHFTAEVATTGALLYAVVAFVLAIILAFSCMNSSDEYNLWPERKYHFRGPMWASFISLLGAVILAVSLGAMAIETFKTCRTVESIRRKPKKHLEDEPQYYKFDYRKIPRVAVQPNPILAHVYTNPAMAPHPRMYVSTSPYPTTPSANSEFSYGTQPISYHPPAYAQPTTAPRHPPSYDQSSRSGLDGSYGDSDMDRSSTGVTVDEKGHRMVSI